MPPPLGSTLGVFAKMGVQKLFRAAGKKGGKFATARAAAKGANWKNLAWIRHYTTGAYKNLNTALRNPAAFSAKKAAKLRGQADQISSSLAKLPARPGTTYRGTDLPPGVLAKYRVGQTVPEHGFMSTSTNPAVASGFQGNTVLSVIGRNGKDVGPFSKYAGEAEILFDKGTNFKVLDRVDGPDGISRIVLMEA